MHEEFLLRSKTMEQLCGDQFKILTDSVCQGDPRGGGGVLLNHNVVHVHTNVGHFST